MQIIAVGLDTPADNLEWATEEGFQYEVWTDDHSILGITYGALTTLTDTSVSRITVLLDETGALALEYKDGIDVSTHPDDVLHDCEILFGE